ncbi:unnamed protein product [Schistocephalus solidus]|uniref:Uncharacterized protein n=1 Tax=Schistocephalus solidus TaxID=70667 RepID=A0A183TFJ9_SCHSO|nr:unnamed protein product [Schistocephalus solidus]
MAESKRPRLPRHISAKPERETTTSVPPITLDAVGPKTINETINPRKKSQLVKPSTSSAIDSLTKTTDYNSLPSAPGASQESGKTGHEQASALPSPANSVRAINNLANDTPMVDTNQIDREKCIIIQGLPESCAITSSERVSDDLVLFQDLLNIILESSWQKK